PKSDIGTNYFCEKPLTLPEIVLIPNAGEDTEKNVIVVAARNKSGLCPKELVLDSALIFEFENKARRFADEFFNYFLQTLL
ncbi:MAG: hypothetical protein MJZ05_09485, partial [Fibrobacter sp.]|nr:hypothetical protein [Fibrobacter sp.]